MATGVYHGRIRIKGQPFILKPGESQRISLKQFGIDKIFNRKNVNGVLVDFEDNLDVITLQSFSRAGGRSIFVHPACEKCGKKFTFLEDHLWCEQDGYMELVTEDLYDLFYDIEYRENVIQMVQDRGIGDASKNSKSGSVQNNTKRSKWNIIKGLFTWGHK